MNPSEKATGALGAGLMYAIKNWPLWFGNALIAYGGVQIEAMVMSQGPVAVALSRGLEDTAKQSYFAAYMFPAQIADANKNV